MAEEKREVIAHWEKMITWAKSTTQQDVDEYFEHWDFSDKLFFMMEKELGENWSETYCVYCKKWNTYDSCPACPLAKAGYCCTDDDSLYYKLLDAESLSEWIESAEKFLEILMEVE